MTTEEVQNSVEPTSQSGEAARTPESVGGPRRPPTSPVNRWLIGFLLLLLGALLYQTASRLGQNWMSQDRVPEIPGELLDVEKATIRVFDSASPGVVSVTRVDLVSTTPAELSEVLTGSGSGVVWDTQGHIVTNEHVLAGSEKALVTMIDGSQFQAAVVGRVPELDLALLKVDAAENKLFPIKIGTSYDLRVGQHVIAIGYPHGLPLTLTTGVISGLGRLVPASMDGQVLMTTAGNKLYIPDMIQTDARLRQGNSGGPLLDSSGRLVGISNLMLNPDDQLTGGLAIPIDLVNQVVPLLIENGQTERVGLGITYVERSRVQALRDAGVLTSRGVLVREVLVGMGAADAGIRPTRLANRGDIGDLIVGIEDVDVETPEQLFAALQGYEAGDEVDVRVIREGETLRIPVRLSRLPYVYML